MQPEVVLPALTVVVAGLVAGLGPLPAAKLKAKAKPVKNRKEQQKQEEQSCLLSGRLKLRLNRRTQYQKPSPSAPILITQAVSDRFAANSPYMAGNQVSV